jgi:hypothetical protein
VPLVRQLVLYGTGMRYQYSTSASS